MDNPCATYDIVATLKQGGLVAYPTEAVYGIGCDPMNQQAVNHVLALKHRAWTKGFILIASHWEQISHFVEPIPEEIFEEVMQTWPGPITWLFPANEKVPSWIRGQHDTVALRITRHPIASLLCAAWGGALVSTSANLEGQSPARSMNEVKLIFDDKINFYVEGEVDWQANPTLIRDVMTGTIIRNSEEVKK